MDNNDYMSTERLEDNTGYRKLLGKLLYLTNTRPDISYVVQQLSQHLEAPHQAHLVAAHRILRYLKGKPKQGLFNSANKDIQIKGYVDSDWGNCI